MTTTIAAPPVPKAPGGLPLIGHGVAMMRRPLEFLTALRQYGDVVKIKLGPDTVHVITDAELSHRILTGSHDQGLMVEKARPLLGDGVGMLSGEPHRFHRRLMQPAFHKQQIASYADTMSRVGVEFTQAWQPGQVMQVDEQMNALALITVATTLFSADLSEAIEEIQRSLPIILADIPRQSMAPKWVTQLPTARNRAFATAVERLHTATREAVAATRQSSADNTDLVSILLQTRDDETGRSLTDQQVHDQVVNMMVAGSETTGASLAWTFHELGRNPEIEARLHEEVDKVLGGRPARFDDIAALDYTRRVVMETLRLYPPYIIVRHAPEPTQVGEVLLPAGASILISPYALHRDERFYPEPLRFDPDRWLPDRVSGLPRGAHLPFGAGQRQCPGNHFALTELVIHIATIAASWRFEPRADTTVAEIARGAAVQPGPMPMTAIPRLND
jgi:cytochrome P450